MTFNPNEILGQVVTEVANPNAPVTKGDIYALAVALTGLIAVLGEPANHLRTEANIYIASSVREDLLKALNHGKY